MVSSLTFEINQLRRRLKIAEGDKGGAAQQNNGSNTNGEAYQQMSYAVADAEVDEMLNKPGGFAPTKFVDKELAQSATPFERWKMNQFIFTPDTPAASEEYDRQVVQMLLEASTLELNKDMSKPTKAKIAKVRRTDALQSPLKPLTSSGNRTHLITTADGGANVYETVAVDVLEASDLPPHSAVGGARRGQEDKIYFLDKGAPNAMWGTAGVQALQRAHSLGGTVGFGAGQETLSSRESTARPGTVQAGQTSRSQVTTAKTMRHSSNQQSLSQSLPHALGQQGFGHSHGQGQGHGHGSPESRRTKGINSMIV